LVDGERFEGGAFEAGLVEQSGWVEEAVEVEGAAVGEEGADFGGALLLGVDPEEVAGGFEGEGPGAAKGRDSEGGDVVAQAWPLKRGGAGFAERGRDVGQQEHFCYGSWQPIGRGGTGWAGTAYVRVSSWRFAMVCQACGSPVAGSGAFCTRCGVQAPAGPPMYGMQGRMMVAPRVQGHLQTLGILWCVYGVYRAAAGILAVLVLAGISMSGRLGEWGGPNDLFFLPHASWMTALLPVVVVYTLISSAFSFVTGFALMRRLPWGRVVAIVMGVLALLKPVMGTALGIYTLWVLAPGASGVEYDAMADRG